MSLALTTSIISFILFLVVFTAFEAFDRLSGGQIMKLEDSEPELAARLNHWLEKSDSIRAVFKLLLFILVALLGLFSLQLFHYQVGNIPQEWQVPFIIGAIIVYWSTVLNRDTEVRAKLNSSEPTSSVSTASRI